MKDRKKDGFVFHFDFIADIPEEHQAEYAMHAIRYARDGLEPAFTDWRDVALWNKIKARMDSDSENWSNTVRNRTLAGRSHRGNQYQSAMEQNGTNGTDLPSMEQNGTNGTVSESESVSGGGGESVPAHEKSTTTTGIHAHIKDRLDALGYSYDVPALEAIARTLESGGLGTEYMDFINEILSVKRFKGTRFADKPPAERKSIFLNALTSWSEYRAEYASWIKKERDRAAAERKRDLMRICPACGGDMYVVEDVARCRSCRDTFEMKDGRWIPQDGGVPDPLDIF